MPQFILQRGSLVHRCLRSLLQHLSGSADRVLLLSREGTVGSQYQSKLYRFRSGTCCSLVTQYWDRHLNSVLADTSSMETENADKAKVPGDGHVSSRRIVRFPSYLVADD